MLPECAASWLHFVLFSLILPRIKTKVNSVAFNISLCGQLAASVGLIPTMNKTTALVVGFGFGAVSYMIARERVWNSAESASRALSDSQKKIVGSQSIPEVRG